MLEPPISWRTSIVSTTTSDNSDNGTPWDTSTLSRDMKFLWEVPDLMKSLPGQIKSSRPRQKNPSTYAYSESIEINRNQYKSIRSLTSFFLLQPGVSNNSKFSCVIVKMFPDRPKVHIYGSTGLSSPITTCKQLNGLFMFLCLFSSFISRNTMLLRTFPINFTESIRIR